MNSAGFVETRHLVDTDWVAAHLDDPSVRIFDCTLLSIASAGRPARTEPVQAHWAVGHVPGAGWLDLKNELSDPRSRWPLQHTMPRLRQFSDVMGRKGVGRDTHVVLYSAGHPMAAARVWWMLHAYGFDDACVVDGGWERWVAEDRPVSCAPCEYPATNFEGHVRPGAVVSRIDVRAAISDPGVLIVNALSRQQHSGEGVHFGRAGRIPGSRCVPAQELVNPRDGRFRSPAELRRLFRAAGLRDGQRVITYCSSGIAAACDAFALAMLGHEDVALYDGSLAEWSNDPTLPMETG